MGFEESLDAHHDEGIAPKVAVVVFELVRKGKAGRVVDNGKLRGHLATA